MLLTVILLHKDMILFQKKYPGLKSRGKKSIFSNVYPKTTGTSMFIGVNL